MNTAVLLFRHINYAVLLQISRIRTNLSYLLEKQDEMRYNMIRVDIETFDLNLAILYKLCAIPHRHRDRDDHKAPKSIRKKNGYELQL